MITAFRLILLTGLVICAVATAIVKKPMQCVIIYMAYSVIMSVIWILLQSPDLAITEAAVGTGITGILFFLTLRRLNLVDQDEAHKRRLEAEEREKLHREQTPPADQTAPLPDTAEQHEEAGDEA